MKVLAGLAGLAGLAVADVDVALGWYERLLGRPADALPMDGLAESRWSSSAGLATRTARERTPAPRTRRPARRR